MDTNRGCGDCWGQGTGWICDLFVLRMNKHKEVLLRTGNSANLNGWLANVLARVLSVGAISGYRDA